MNQEEKLNLLANQLRITERREENFPSIFNIIEFFLVG